MNLYFSSVASQPPPGHSLMSKANTNVKYSGQSNNVMYSSKPHVTLSNALDLLTGNSGSCNNNTSSGTGSGHNQTKKSEETTPVNITLRRASVDSPWGFRVQGGSDYHLQLTICKTQSGSPSEGVLHSGDAILSINGESARSLSHEEATQKIRSAGTDLQLTVARRQTCDLSDIRPKGQLKFTAPQNNRR
ncbi:unnamed protein product [Heterobilharzia americana]|nr:unnamed protein product [Heterobilharzia americana]CAH8516730.1 unnamed protein product [Heterobilharzia americana]